MTKQFNFDASMISPIDSFGGFYYDRLIDLERIRRLEVESLLGPPPDNFLGRRDKWLEEQREYTLAQANALWVLIEARKAK